MAKGAVDRPVSIEKFGKNFVADYNLGPCALE